MAHEQDFRQMAKNRKFVPHYSHEQVTKKELLEKSPDKGEDEFEHILEGYVDNGLDRKYKNRFIFKDDEIKKIPLLKREAGKHQLHISFRDSSDESMQLENVYLLLRITPTKKSFYIKSRRTANLRPTENLLGHWQPRANGGRGSRPPKGFLTTVDAKAAFQKKAKELLTETAESRLVSQMTIREYITTQYRIDREDKLMRNGRQKPVTDRTIKQLIQGFPKWIDKRLDQINKDWPGEFKVHWKENERIDRQTGEKILGIKLGTMRKYYTMLNAVVNMCVSKGYLAKNPFAPEDIKLFPKDKNPSKIRHEYVNEEIVDYIFTDEVPGSRAGKLIVACMILTGARNSEIYRNYKKNFDPANFSIYIPPEISKSGANRTAYTDNKTFWEQFKLYSKYEHFDNAHGHMFPAVRSESGHISDGTYRMIWPHLKAELGLKGRLYDVRHTFIKRVNDKYGLTVASQMAGSSTKTVSETYAQNDEEALKRMSLSMSEQSTKTDTPEPVVQQSPVSNDVVVVNEELLPSAIQPLFTRFKNGKSLPAPNQLYVEQMKKFIDFVAKKHEKNDLGDDVDDWLDMQ